MIANQRYLARIAATFLSRSQSVAFLTDHVTSNGVFVRTDSPPPVMELLRIELVLPSASRKIVLHGMVTEVIPATTKHAAPGVEIAFFAKGGEAGQLWDEFIAFVRESHPESLVRPITLAEGATDQIRRAHPRFHSMFPIELDSVGAESATVGDISQGGMFIRTREEFVIGSNLRITITDPSTQAKAQVYCVVRRRASGANPGIGVEFRDMNDSQRQFLGEVMRVARESAPASAPVMACCEELRARPAPRIMQTYQGPAGFKTQASMTTSDYSLTLIDQEWPII
jgi:Tfp pilus assembly protein PilZ